ncbi:MAG: tRNA-dihydrouridine synthase family protein [Nanoarchaeota archaeon]
MNFKPNFNNKFYYMLAPLEDFTDSCFRTLCYRYGADLTMTELVKFESLAKNNKTSWERTKQQDDTLLAIQILGSREQFLKKFLSKFQPEKGFAGFNLNLGCPAPNVINNGAGCAMVKRISKTRTLISIIKDHGYNTSIKMRLGLNQYEKEKKAYLNLINNINADFFVVHARHGAQTYAEKADWSVFPECVKTGKNIIANGDIKTKADVEQIKSFGCKGVMIGRAAITNPLIFAELKGLALPPVDKIKKEYDQLLQERNPPFKYQKNIFKHLKTDTKFEEK